MKAHEYYYLAKRNLLNGAENRSRILGQVKKGSRVHVSAVCGKAMASVACLLQEFGCIVTGSDSKFSPPMSDVLDAHGVKKLEPSIDNLKDIDLLVVGNALAHSSLEVVEARAKSIPMVSGAEAVAQIFQDKRSLVVAGTHGKTTTSGLLAHLFIESGKDPAYMIGGAFQKSNDSYSIGGEKNPVVIYEGDEYNCAYFDQAPKFLRYNPASTIITSIEQDHIDLYPTFEDYKQAFQFLIEELPKDGFLVIHESAGPFLDLSRCQAKTFTYGTSQQCDARYKIVEANTEGTIFSIDATELMSREEFSIPMFGEYNVQNAVSTAVLARLEGLSTSEIRAGLKSFSGTRERQEVVGTRKDGTTIIRDYAHHPTAVTVTLAGLRQHYPTQRIISVFEPLSASSRRKIFEERYGEALANSDISIIIQPRAKEGDDTSNQLDADRVKEIIESHARGAHRVYDSKESLEVLAKVSAPGDIVMFMSSGDMAGTPQQFASL